MKYSDNISVFKEKIQDLIKMNSHFLETEESEVLSCAWEHLFKASDVLFKYIEKKENWDEGSIDTVCCMMLLNTQSDLLNALLSTLQGFKQGPGLILRSVIENLACITAIKTNGKMFNQFKEKKLKPTITINPAKKIFPEFGQFYRLFSNFYVHENIDKIGRSIKFKDGYNNFSLLDNIDKDDLIFLPLLIIAIFSRFSGMLTEYCFADRITDFHYWRKIEDNLQSYKNNEEDKLLNRLTGKLYNILN